MSASAPPAPPGELQETRARVLAAAADLFAERGFFGTTVRDIADRARVNVAAGHYHFGSKQELYLEVVRREFDEMAGRLAARGAASSPVEISKASREQLVAMLHARIETMLELLVGPPPSHYGLLMQREMCDPSAALPVIVRRFIRPQKELMERLVGRLAPQLSPRDVRRCCFSIVGQVFFYRFMSPVVPPLLGVAALPPDFVKATAAHVAAFSLAALDALPPSAPRSARRRRPAAAGR